MAWGTNEGVKNKIELLKVSIFSCFTFLKSFLVRNQDTKILVKHFQNPGVKISPICNRLQAPDTHGWPIAGPYNYILKNGEAPLVLISVPHICHIIWPKLCFVIFWYLNVTKLISRISL